MVADGEVLYRRLLKVISGIEPGITLPRKGNLLASYYPKENDNKIIVLNIWTLTKRSENKFELQHRRDEKWAVVASTS